MLVILKCHLNKNLIINMKNRVWIKQLEFSDGSKIQFSKNEIIVFVGPNNAGKSAGLKEIATLLRTVSDNTNVVKSIYIDKEGNSEELLQYIKSTSIKTFYSGNTSPHYKGLNYEIHEPNIIHLWEKKEHTLFDLFPIFVNLLNTDVRLNSANPALNINLNAEPPRHPINFLQKHDYLEEKFNAYFRQAFGTDLIVHRNAGSKIPLYVGEKPQMQSGEDRISFEYTKRLEKLDLLQDQGDGMRSFVGILLNAFISEYSILLIDEPEAFLHPPQARLIGKMLAKDLPPNKQLFLATHSEDFLKGLLDADVANLKILRIQRDEHINYVSSLDNKDINEIWGDPLLRHSNILNGLFHSKVIVCESDTDCRFYSAITSALYEASDRISPDLLFIHCGGKYRIPVAVKSLVKLNVPIIVITDFDILKDEKPLREIYEQMGGEWIDIDKDWKKVKTSIDKKKPELNKEDLKKEFDQIFTSISNSNISSEEINQFQKLLKKASAWAYAKEVGKAFIPSGDETNAYENIQTKLKAKGLFIVEVGQLESFCKSVGSHGPKWVNEVMKKNFKEDTELEQARRFVSQIIF